MTLAALQQALANPAIYPEPTSSVQVRETHISLVFLTDQYVYKIKKPVNLGFLDYATLAQRQVMCEQELQLNRRLSSDIYLDVVAIYQQGQTYTFIRTGSVVEYAVKMRRLPEDATLYEYLQHQGAPLDTMRLLARKLATFHAAHPAPKASIPYGSRERVMADWQENFAQTIDVVGHTLSRESYHRIEQSVGVFLMQRAAWFGQRIEDGHIRDCHGDLRAEHIYLEGNQVQIIDCIEFNPQFRYIDAASEIAFLAMDLERLGFSAHADVFVRAYVAAVGDVTLYRLLDFYRCYRAYVRGKVRSFLWRDAGHRRDHAHRLLHEAQTYFDLAARYAQRLTRPILVMTTGLIGSGKSTIAQGVAEALGLELYRSDQIRKTRAGLTPDTPQRVAYGTGLYSASVSEQTYEALAVLARDALQRGASVIVDAAFSKQAQRLQFHDLAQAAGADCYLLECLVPEETLRARLQRRMQTPGVISDGRLEILPQFKQSYEPVQNIGKMAHIRLDATQPIAQCVQHALSTIQEARTAFDQKAP
jgi:aminoglycoside phosphotransferase family enzyme/predicted kinase